MPMYIAGAERVTFTCRIEALKVKFKIRDIQVLEGREWRSVGARGIVDVKPNQSVKIIGECYIEVTGILAELMGATRIYTTPVGGMLIKYHVEKTKIRGSVKPRQPTSPEDAAIFEINIRAPYTPDEYNVVIEGGLEAGYTFILGFGVWMRVSWSETTFVTLRVSIPEVKVTLSTDKYEYYEGEIARIHVKVEGLDRADLPITVYYYVGTVRKTRTVSDFDFEINIGPVSVATGEVKQITVNIAEIVDNRGTRYIPRVIPGAITLTFKSIPRVTVSWSPPTLYVTPGPGEAVADAIITGLIPCKTYHIRIFDAVSGKDYLKQDIHAEKTMYIARFHFKRPKVVYKQRRVAQLVCEVVGPSDNAMRASDTLNVWVYPGGGGR